MGKIEERLNAVNDEHAKMRAELEAYVQEVRDRTDDSGEKLVEFPENFDLDTDQEAKREAGWRKFISSQVLDHPNEEEERKVKKQLELGLEKIQELDEALEKAEMKYLESKRNMKGTEESESEYAEPKQRPKRRTKSPPASPTDGDATRVDEVNKRSAQLGRQVLLTEEEEARVSDIMADLMDEIKQEAQAELYGQKMGEGAGDAAPPRVVDPPNAYCLESEQSEVLVDLETQLVEHQDLREHAAPTGLVFDERRGTYILVDPADVNKEKSKREPTLKSNDVLSNMRRKRIEKQKLEQIDNALEAMKDAPVQLVEKKYRKEENSPARRPTSLRAFLKPVSPNQIHAAVKEARKEVVEVADPARIEELVDRAKKTVIVATEESPGKDAPKETPGRDESKSCASPPPKDKTVRRTMKKSASVAAAERSPGARQIEATTSATSLHGDASPKKSVFGWKRTTTERYIQGSKKPVVKKSQSKGRKSSPNKSSPTEARYKKK